ncbi:PTS sugar transporter subunit IIC [Lactobacillus sp. ESL0731]|uniref:PTS sugar transporter subunit IIC n=1 Tax=unclassified Lactobacillus TaxID=2620435 RepID=UPI0023F7356E|nr:MULTISPECIES: PTS sugar transporter subunit IIC [unclassified Lactobacillus]WEV51748.1 PTS sugar transporter subunit IIC [Lactobacillus sp. ESL0700]WEV62877.1 PTS sugar transporter subunit IIC [Lactobacillus sp. ESL0731]
MQNKFEKVLMPLAEKLSNNVVLRSLRDGFLIITPLIIVTSIFLLIGNFPIPGWVEFWTKLVGPQFSVWFSAVSNSVFSFTGILSTIAIAYAYGKNRGLNPIQAGMVSFISFLILTPTEIQVGKQTLSAINLQYVGPNGIFLGIIISLISVEIYRFAVNRHWTIKMPDGVPPAVTQSFDALIPSALVVLAFFIIRILFSLTSFTTAYNFIYKILQTPLKNVGISLPSALLYNFLASFLWFFGINGPTITNSVWEPIFFVATQDNMKAFQNHLPLPHVYNQPFIDIFTTYGGGGSTLALLIVVFAICKSKRIRELGDLAILPGIFGINEPVIFGLPIVLNPVIMIPFIACPVLNTFISGVTMSLGWVAKTNGVSLPWTTPPIISGWLATGSWTGSALQIVELILNILIYYPFVKMLDKQYLKEEKAAAEDELDIDFSEV